MTKKSLLTAAGAAFFAALFFLPFRGVEAAAIAFAAVLAGLPLLEFLRKLGQGEKRRIPTEFLRLDRKLLWFAPVVTLVFAGLPLLVKDYYLDILIISGIYMLLAFGLNVIVGFAGLLNLGFAAFYAIGAYSFALINTRLGLGFWEALPLSTAITACAGFLLAIPALRLRGDYLAIVTLGFGEITRLVLNNWDSLTHGPNGITGIASPSLFGVSLGKLQYFYYLVLAVVLLSMVVIRRVENSRIGRAWLAIRENEIAASSMGINTTRYKLFAFSFGSLWAGVAGALFASKMQFVSPESFTFMESVLILSMVIIGGLGNTYGAVIGALILVLLPEALRGIESYRMLILGASLVALMIFRPQGLLGGYRGVRIRG